MRTDLLFSKDVESQVSVPFQALSFFAIVSLLAYSTLDLFQTDFSRFISPVRNAELRVLILVVSLTALAALARMLPDGAAQGIPFKSEKKPFSLQMEIVRLWSASDSLLSLRFFAFFCVFVTHVFISFDLNKFAIATFGSLSFLARGCAHSGMFIFFTLSGYLMGKAFVSGRYQLTRKGLRDFYLNRCLRIVPLYVFSVLVFTLLTYPETFRPEKISSLWRVASFNYYGQDGRDYGALWSLTVEMQYYLLAPFVFALFGTHLKTQKHVILFWLAVSIFAVAARGFLFAIGTDLYGRYVSPLCNFPLFLLGFGLNFIKDLPTPRAYRATILAVALFLAGSFWEYTETYGERNLTAKLLSQVFPLIICFDVLALILCLDKISTSKRFERRSRSYALNGLGILTYSFYVWHPPLLIHFAKLSEIQSLADHCLMICESICAISFISLGSYLLIERPFEKQKFRA